MGDTYICSCVVYMNLNKYYNGIVPTGELRTVYLLNKLNLLKHPEKETSRSQILRNNLKRQFQRLKR
jgi:hypothetical protein